MENTEIDLETVLARITGKTWLFQNGPTHISRTETWRQFKELDPLFDEKELHLIVDDAGGFRVINPEDEKILREGHLSEFKEPGFSGKIVVDINIFDSETFAEDFDCDPDQPLTKDDLMSFIAIPYDIMNNLTIEDAKLSPRPGLPHLLEIEAKISDEESFMSGLMNQFISCWGSEEGFPVDRIQAIYEACVASNGNSSPVDHGFEIFELHRDQSSLTLTDQTPLPQPD